MQKGQRDFDSCTRATVHALTTSFAEHGGIPRISSHHNLTRRLARRCERAGHRSSVKIPSLQGARGPVGNREREGPSGAGLRALARSTDPAHGKATRRERRAPPPRLAPNVEARWVPCTAKSCSELRTSTCESATIREHSDGLLICWLHIFPALFRSRSLILISHTHCGLQKPRRSHVEEGHDAARSTPYPLSRNAPYRHVASPRRRRRRVPPVQLLALMGGTTRQPQTAMGWISER